jgi:hypothetical protein
MSDVQRAAQALQAGRRVTARGQRPLYRLTKGNDGRFAVEGATWLTLLATNHRDATAEARVVISEWLDVPSDAFDLETGA